MTAHTITRRQLMAGTLAVGIASCAPAQQPRVYRVAMISPAPSNAPHPFLRAFLDRMRELGYRDGDNLAMEYRYGENDPDRIPVISAEAAASRPDVIVVLGIGAAAKAATTEIPIVDAFAPNPIELGLAPSFARPGGNITGVVTLDIDVAPKQLELLRQIVPTLSRLVLLYGTNPPNVLFLQRVKQAADAAGIRIVSSPLTSDRDVEARVIEGIRDGAEGLMAKHSNFIYPQRARLAALAGQNHLAAVYPNREYTDAGGLASYGFSTSEALRVTAGIVDRIFRGARPADIPFESVTRVELVVNLRAALSQGVVIPQSLLAIADDIIR